MKRFLCGILITVAILQPISLIAEEPILDEPVKLIINEVMTGSEINPEKDVWIELFNPNETTVDLKDWQIKGVTKGGRWINIFDDSDLSVEAKGYYLISYYTNSSYSALSIKPDIKKSSLAFPNNPIEIELKNPTGETVDSAIVPTIDSDEFRSYERIKSDSDGTLPESWQTSNAQSNLKEGLEKTFATPGAENSQQTEIPEEIIEGGGKKEEDEEKIEEIVLVWYPTYELISEVMVNPEGKDTESEWIELFNPTSDAIDLGGWYLDDAEENSSPFRIRNNTWIGAGSYKVFTEPELKLSFKNSEDEVRLLDPNKTPKEVIKYKEAKEGWSYAKSSENEFVWTPITTFNAQNNFPAPPKSYLPDSIIFYKIMPNPDGNDKGSETITIKSNLGDLVDLKGWKIKNSKEKEYELLSQTISSQEKVILDPSAFGLTLTNKADQLSLIDPVGNLIDRINWNDVNADQIVYRPDFFRNGINARVTSVIDGDTLKAIINDEEFTIRLIGVDAPESVHPRKPIEPFGIESKTFLEQRALNREVVIEFDQNKFDKYNRLLAYVYSDNHLLNSELIKNGLAKTYPYFPFQKLDEFLTIEQEAKVQKTGMWETSATTASEDLNPHIDLVSEDPNPHIDVENIELLEDIVIQEIIEVSEPTSETKCKTNGLKIDSFLPNSEKGKTHEYIRIINNSDEKVCLHGWQLDDGLGIGSKPFSIKGGAIMPGGIRTFRKSETKLSLNNKNDCVNLINPIGETVDRICYTKTHKNEIFTHNGGNWKPKPKKAKVKKITTPKAKSQESTAFQWDLKNESIEGEIVFVYEENELFYVKKDEKIIPVSYANSQVNLSAAKELLDLNSNVKLDLRTNGISNELIAISQEKQPEAANSEAQKQSEKQSWPIWFILLAGYPAMWIYLKRKTQMSS